VEAAEREASKRGQGRRGMRVRGQTDHGRKFDNATRALFVADDLGTAETDLVLNSQVGYIEKVIYNNICKDTTLGIGRLEENSHMASILVPSNMGCERMLREGIQQGRGTTWEGQRKAGGLMLCLHACGAIPEAVSSEWRRRAGAWQRLLPACMLLYFVQWFARPEEHFSRS
jgi:hypothetical protein